MLITFIGTSHLGELERKLTKYIRRISITWRPSSKTMSTAEGRLLNNNNDFSFAAQIIMETNKGNRERARACAREHPYQSEAILSLHISMIQKWVR